MTPRTLVLIACSSCILLASGAARAQETAPPVPTGLDDMIAAALKASPEVVLAEAKLRQAQAELSQIRLQVTRSVVRAYNDRKHQETVVATSVRRFRDIQGLEKGGAVSGPDVEEAKAKLSMAELCMAQADAEIRYLLGVGSQLAAEPTRNRVAEEPAKPRTAARPEKVPEPLVEPLQKQVTGPFENTNVADVLKRLSEQAGVAIMADAGSNMTLAEWPVSMPLREPLTLATVLQALSDQHPNLCFLLRPYGILAASEKRAREIKAPTIPEGLPMHVDAK